MMGSFMKTGEERKGEQVFFVLTIRRSRLRDVEAEGK